MGILITGIRIWCAFICITFLLLFDPLIFVLESIVVLLVFFFAAIFMSKDDIKKSWIGSYPNLARKIKKVILKLWDWALIELNDINIGKIILSALVGVLALGLPLLVIVMVSILFWGVVRIILLVALIITVLAIIGIVFDP
jgi:hypothetical protein